MYVTIRNSTSKLDWLGIVLSSACAVHCLAVPILLPLLLTLKLGFFAEEGFEFWSWAITFGLCLLITVYQFLVKHKHGTVFIPLAIAFGFILNKDIFGESAEPYVAVVAGLLLVLTHILNLRMCKLCPTCRSKVNYNEHKM